MDWSEPMNPEEWHNEFVELPAKVTAMEQIDGRLMVRMEDGRTVDITDWFTPTSRAN